MFKNEYQGGGYVEVFSAQGRDPMARWRVTGTVRKEYSKEIRGYICVMEGASSTTRIQLPKSDKGLLGLLQPYCVLQLLVPADARFTIELSVLDSGGSRRRLQLSTSLREMSASPLNARAPLPRLCRGEWLNLCLDLRSLVAGLFKGQEFKSLEGVSIGGTCNLRRIFTLRAPPPPTLGDGGCEATEELPRACRMSVPVLTQVVSSSTLLGQPAQPTDSSSHSASEKKSTHIAFGSKINIPNHILHSRATSRSNSSSMPRAGSGGRGTSLTSETVVGGRGIQPHPPPHPADVSMVRVQRKRLQVVRRDKMEGRGGVPGTDRAHKMLPDGLAPSVSGSDSGYRTEESDQRLDHESSETGQCNHEDSLEGDDGELTADEQLVVDVLREVLIADDVIHESDDPDVLSDQDTTNLTDGDTTMEEDDVSVYYSYRSPPKSAGSREPVLQSDQRPGGASRGPGLEDDFVFRDSKQNKREPTLTTAHELTETRLSDDYDWRQYASVEDFPQTDVSLRARLAADSRTHVTTDPTQLPLVLSSDTAHSSDMGTLSDSMTMSNWTERQVVPALDSLDMRALGGTMSPAATMTIDPLNHNGAWQGREDELELMYDPQLNCFYDPQTCKYYELVQ